MTPKSETSYSRLPKDRPEWADQLGICLSALCVVHCLLTPVLILALPSFALFMGHDRVHGMFLIILPLLALIAFIPGYRRHKQTEIFMWSVPGFILLTIALLVLDSNPWAEAGVSIIGSACLIRAHLINRRLCACCETDHVGHGSMSAAPAKPRVLTPPRP